MHEAAVECAALAAFEALAQNIDEPALRILAQVAEIIVARFELAPSVRTGCQLRLQLGPDEILRGHRLLRR